MTDFLDSLAIISQTAGDIFKTYAQMEDNQANRIHQENLAITLEDKKQHNKKELLELKHEDEINEGMFTENNRMIASKLAVAKDHNLLQNDIFNLSTDLDGKYAVGSESSNVLKDFGMGIQNDLQFAFNVGTDINNHRKGVKEAIQGQNDIINLLDSRLSEVDNALTMIDDMDITAGLNLLDSTKDITDFEVMIQEHPEIFGYAGYADMDFDVVGELPTQRPDFFMPSNDVGVLDEDTNQFIPIDGKENEFMEQKEIYGQKEYIRKAVLNSVPDISPQISNAMAFTRLKDILGYTDEDGVKHKSAQDREKDKNEYNTLKDKIKLAKEEADDLITLENKSYEDYLGGIFESIAETEATYAEDSKAIQMGLAATNTASYKTFDAVNIADSDDLSMNYTMQTVNKIGSVILGGLDKDLNVNPFNTQSYDTNAHIFKLFGVELDEMGYDKDSGKLTSWTGAGNIVEQANTKWASMSNNEKIKLVNNFKMMIMPTSDELLSGNASTNSFGTSTLNHLDPQSQVRKGYPFASIVGDDDAYVSQKYDYDKGQNEGGNAYYVNTGVPYFKDENIDINDENVVSKYVIGGKPRIIAYDAGGEKVSLDNPDAVKYDGVRKSQPGDGSAYWQPVHRVDLMNSDFDWEEKANTFFGEDIVDTKLLGGTSVSSANTGNIKNLTQLIEAFDILSKKTNAMNTVYFEELMLDMDYKNQINYEDMKSVGLDDEMLFTKK